MALSLLTNLSSLSAQRNVDKSQSMLQKSIERLSSGKRINSASDDAAGLAISSALTAEIGSVYQARRNAQDAVSLVQTAESSMGEINSLLTRMRSLAIQSANGGTLTDTNRTSVDAEFQALFNEIDRIVSVTTYNGQKLIDGSFSTGASFQVGAYNNTNNTININIANVGTGSTALNIASAGSLNAIAVNTVANSKQAIDRLDTAIATLASDRASFGAAQSRLVTTIDNLNSQYINGSAANSRIVDVDVAEETATLARTQILVQAGVSVLAQANQQPQIALSLLGR